MRSIICFSVLILLLPACLSAQKAPVDKKKTAAPVVVKEEDNSAKMENKKDSLSYALGILLQANLKNQGFGDLNYELFAKAMQEAAEGKAQMNIPHANVVVQDYQEALNKEKYGNIQAEGAAFLAENSKKEGVVTLPSGLQYKVLRAGEGAKPTATSNVNVHYEGRLLDGKIFDSSYQRGEPISFGLNQVIRGWVEGLQQMNTGAKYELYIPYNLAYGERGSGQSIPPYATLIFVVELLSFK
jgi:FKBP-type peptidyl-prolyl cis-trans isomerase FklB